MVRVPGAGLAVQPRPKTTTGWRVVALPDFAVRMLEDRRGGRSRQSDAEVVFPPPLSGILRDPSNVSGDLRQLLDSFQCEICAGTGYQLDEDGSFRDGSRRTTDALRGRAVALGHLAHLPQDRRHTPRRGRAHPRQVADQLGHANPSMTLDVYFGFESPSEALDIPRQTHPKYGLNSGW